MTLTMRQNTHGSAVVKSRDPRFDPTGKQASKALRHYPVVTIVSSAPSWELQGSQLQGLTVSRYSMESRKS